MRHSRIVPMLLAAITGCITSVPTPSVISTVSPDPIRPMLASADMEADYLLPGPMVEHEGALHFWAGVFDAEGGPRFVHLTSADATTWTGDASARAIDAGALELDPIGPIPSSVVREDDGTWTMFGSGRRPDTQDQLLWRATAPDLDGPWSMAADPILEPSSGDEWDTALVDNPSVVRTPDGYLMAYGGAAPADPNRRRIGFARSTDGVSWTRYAATLSESDDDRAIGPSACGIEARTMFEPELLAVEGGFRLYFGAMTVAEDMMVIGRLDSDDGITWTCPLNGPILGPSDFDPPADMHSYLAARLGGADRLVVEVLAPDSSDLWFVEPEP